VWAEPWYYRPSYVSSLVRGLSAYASFIQSAPTIVLGDFNSNPCFGDSHFEWVRLLDDLGLVSAYHLHTGEPPGRESTWATCSDHVPLIVDLNMP
jgi:endonuclease/exonuclease/phosphatase family metal-dependent hydrolase